MKLGFFDSGLGGLYVMENVQQQHPEHEYIFLGDTKNLPYGPRESEEIALFIEPLLLYLLEEELCDHVIIACNTASVRAVPIFYNLHPEYVNQVHRIDVPTKHAIANRDLDRLLVLATQQTVNSGTYLELKQQGTKVVQQAMPGLVDLIEDGDWNGAHAMCKDALSYFLNEDKVLLGCTHYLWLASTLRQEYPERTFIGQSEIIADYIQELKPMVASRNIASIRESSLESVTRYFVTGDALAYSKKHHRLFEALKR